MVRKLSKTWLLVLDFLSWLAAACLPGTVIITLSPGPVNRPVGTCPSFLLPVDSYTGKWQAGCRHAHQMPAVHAGAVHAGAVHANVHFLRDPLCLVPGSSQGLVYFWDKFSVCFTSVWATEPALLRKTSPCFFWQNSSSHTAALLNSGLILWHTDAHFQPRL